MASQTLQFEIPSEMAVGERSVEQAKAAFQQLEERLSASQVGALDISKKAMSFAEREADELRRFLCGNPVRTPPPPQKVTSYRTELQVKFHKLGWGPIKSHD